jgi:hypothetical protein
LAANTNPTRKPMSDILNKILAVKAEEVRIAQAARPGQPAPRRRNRQRTALELRGFEAPARQDRRRPGRRDRRGQEGLPSKGVIRADFRRPTSPPATPARRGLPVGADRRAVLPGFRGIPASRPAPPAPSGAAQGFHGRHTRSTKRAPWAPTASC